MPRVDDLVDVSADFLVVEALLARAFLFGSSSVLEVTSSTTACSSSAALTAALRPRDGFVAGMGTSVASGFAGAAFAERPRFFGSVAASGSVSTINS